MVSVTVLRVFVGSEDNGGNPLGVVADSLTVPPHARQRMAAELGFSETVFIDDHRDGRLQIFTPRVELPFAGHPLVGAAWLMAQRGTPVSVLRPPAGDVPTWCDADGVTWIRGRAEWAPAMTLRQLHSAAEVDALPITDDLPFVDSWAWMDERAGVVRSRVFAPYVGIAEDEATGAAAVRLVTALGRPVEIHQGRGSLIFARPGPDGTADVGGHCAPALTRQYALDADTV